MSVYTHCDVKDCTAFSEHPVFTVTHSSRVNLSQTKHFCSWKCLTGWAAVELAEHDRRAEESRERDRRYHEQALTHG
jgi:hypothetical protein